MKKLLLILALSLPGVAFAAGPNDGIYNATLDGSFVFFVSIHQSGDQVIFLTLDNPPDRWEGLTGTRTGDTVPLDAVVASGSIDLTLTFNSATAATATIAACTPDPGQTCSFPNGAILQLSKIF